MTEKSSNSAKGLSEEKRPIKLGVLVSHPIQYFVPVYQELSRHAKIDLTVIYHTRAGVDAYHDQGFGQLVKWDIPLLDGYRSLFLSKKTKLRGIEIGVIKEVLRSRFDVLIVHGYNYPTNLLAIAVAKVAGTRVVIRGDTRLRRHHLQAHGWKHLLKRTLFRVFDGFISIGTLNREYYAAFGAPAERVFFAPFCVNNTAFALDTEAARGARQQSRAAMCLPEDCVVVLYASKLTAQKRPGDLIKAYASLAQKFPNVWLIMAGSGEEERPLKEMADGLGLERIRFIGFQNQTALPNLYAASDIFVLPSDEDAWGLVVNEVMAAGLPVVVSDGVGASPDLVQGRGTGIVYPCGDVNALAQAIEQLLRSEQQRLQMGCKARGLIKNWGVEACASGIVAAAERIVRI